MAVYTRLSSFDIAKIIEHYSLPKLLQFTPILKGVQNSNYLLEFENQKNILTVFEPPICIDQLPYFASLMQTLSNNNIDCPLFLKTKSNEDFVIFNYKPIAIVEFIEGHEVQCAQEEHCRQVGDALSQMHQATSHFTNAPENPYGIEKLCDLWKQILERMPEDHNYDLPLIETCLANKKNRSLNLPQGVIHADLFPDNVFFKEGKINGLIDFYFSGKDAFIYDLCITINAWCFDQNNIFDQKKKDALMQGYTKNRSLTAEEIDAFQHFMQLSCIRFFLTRLFDQLTKSPDDVLEIKDPVVYYERLLHHTNEKVI